MTESLAKLFKHFIVRDLIYAIAGGVLIVGITYAAGNLSQQLAVLDEAPLIVTLLVAGVAWAVGYGVSDGLGGVVPTLLPTRVQQLWPLVPPYLPQAPGPWLQRRFDGFTSIQWPEGIAKSSPRALGRAADALINQEFGEYHRTVLLRHLGGAVGACGCLASLIVLVAAVFRSDSLAFTYSMTGLLLSALLVVLGLIKALQQTYFAYQYLNRSSNTTEQEAVS
jgi:hypothetical protein